MKLRVMRVTEPEVSEITEFDWEVVASQYIDGGYTVLLKKETE